METGGLSSATRRAACALLACALFLTVAPAVAAPPIVWLESSWTRVSPTAPAGTATELTIYAARGEYESFQILVRAPAGGLTHATVAPPALVGPSGATIPPTNVTLYREHYVQVTVSSPGGSQNRPLPPGWYPDALIPFLDPITGRPVSGGIYGAAPFTVAADRNQPVWVDVLVPRTAPAGPYRATFTVTSDQGAASVDLTLVVWGFEVPLLPGLKSCFGNNVAGDGEVLELLRNRLMPRHVTPSEERALIDTLGLNCTNAGFWSGADGSTCAMRPAPSVSSLQAAEAQHVPDLFLYNYTADEILSCTNVYATLRQWALNIHQTRLFNLVTMPPVPDLYDDGSGTGRSAVDIWVVLPKQYDQHRDPVVYVLDKGDRVWSYNCLTQDPYSPKWLLDYAPVNYRLQPGFLSQSMGLTGLLYWSVDHWTSDPWNNVHTYHGGYPGEGMLVYPGAQVGLPGQVVPSMRLKYLRDGVDDYDYVELLKQRGVEDWALSVVRGVAPDWTNWTRDPAALEQARSQLASALESTFPDVPTIHWAYPCIMALRAVGYVRGYDDGTYRPAAPVTRDQMAVYLGRALAGGEASIPSGPDLATFPDVAKGSWAYNHVEYIASLHIVAGYDDGTYRPAVVVTRDQMAVFVARSICDPTGDEGLVSFVPPASPSFRDVRTGHWAYTYVEYCHAQGIVNGYDDDTYRPRSTVTRDQMAVYIVRAFGLPIPDLPSLPHAPPRGPGD